MPAAEVDHIIPKYQGGTNDDSNLEGICKACHRAKTPRERR
ncbi:HNH endonuclease [Erwinia tracheiphila]